MNQHLLATLLIIIFTCGWSFAAEPGSSGGVPPGEKDAKAVLNKSPRHGEWVEINIEGRKTPLKAWVVYPERKDKAPVVIVIQEIFGLTDWLRSVADQLAADGFIAIAPDLLSGHGPSGGGTDSFADRDAVTRAVFGLKHDEVAADLAAVREYGMKLPSSDGKTASIGFCWGGGQSFAFAVDQPDLSAAVVYYGTPPAEPQREKTKAPVMGFYGGKDNRVTGTVSGTESAMKRLDKSYTPHVYEGAGHGFLRAQEPGGGPNAKAAAEAWPETIKFLREKTK
jgi:carboxymethylenebutenolidase